MKLKRKRSLSDVTNVFNQSRDSVVSKSTIQRKLYSKGYNSWVVKMCIWIRDVSRKNRLNCCRAKRWKRVIFSDKCEVATDKDVGGEWLPGCFPLALKLNLMIWGYIRYDTRIRTVVNGNIYTKQIYCHIWCCSIWYGKPSAQTWILCMILTQMWTEESFS